MPPQPPLFKTVLAPIIWLPLVGLIVFGFSAYILLRQSEFSTSETALAPVHVTHTTNEPTASSTSTPSTIPADWKTYRNEKYGFEVRYPSDWIDDSNDIIYGQGRGSAFKSDMGLGIVYKPDEGQCGHGVGCSFPGYLRLSYTESDLLGKGPINSFAKYVKKYGQLTLEGSEYKTRSFTLDGHSAIKFNDIKEIGPLGYMNPSFAILIEYSPSTIITIESYAFPKYKDYVHLTFEKIVSSFRSIK